MAEITSKAGESRPGKGSRRAKRLSTKVDFTPMVDLGFLLITFFILTSQLQEPKAMSLLMPADGDSTKSGESTVLTVVPLDEASVLYCNGDLSMSLQENSFTITPYVDIRQTIQKKKLALSKTGKFKADDLMLIIKPTTQSSLKRIVDVLDEVAINQLHHYAFVDLNASEAKFLKEKGISH